MKAYIHGHIHHWSLAAHQDIHIVNTLATSYVADPQNPPPAGPWPASASVASN